MKFTIILWLPLFRCFSFCHGENKSLALPISSYKLINLPALAKVNNRKNKPIFGYLYMRPGCYRVVFLFEILHISLPSAGLFPLGCISAHLWATGISNIAALECAVDFSALVQCLYHWHYGAISGRVVEPHKHMIAEKNKSTRYYCNPIFDFGIKLLPR